MINHPELLVALTCDYLNVYVLDLEKDEASAVKLKGYALDSIKASPESFPYSKMVSEYIDVRVYPDDQPGLRNALSRETLRKTFSDGKEKIEIKYRVLIEGKIHFFSVVYTRLSPIGEPLRMVVGFRCIDSIINMERHTRHEGLWRAYEVVSDAYLCMYRVNVQTDEYKPVKTNKLVERYTASPRFSENSKGVVDSLTNETNRDAMVAFLDLKTLDKRMKGKKRIDQLFTSSPSNLRFRLTFIREDDDEKGNLLHAIYAVELIEEDKYQGAFEILSKAFANVFRVDLSTGVTMILKQEGYLSKKLNDKHATEFLYDDVLKQYIEERVLPEDRESLFERARLSTIKSRLEKESEFNGSYRAIANGKVLNFSFDCFKASKDGVAIIGLRNIDAIMQERTEQEKKEREAEEKQRKEMEEQLSIFNNLSRNFRNVYLANLDNGLAKILKLDGAYDFKLLKDLREKIFPFKGALEAWAKDRVHPDDMAALLNALEVENIKKGLEGKEEYTGTYRSYENGKLHHYQYSVTRIDEKRVICGFQMIDRYLEEHLKEEKEKRAKEEALQKERNDKADLIGALATLYTTIFDVKIPEHGYEILTSVALMDETAKKMGNFDDAEEDILKAFIAKDMHKEMRAFLDLDTLSDRLEGRNTVILEYRNPVGRWFEARFIAKKRDESGKAIEALYVARDITGEKEQELQQESALRDALMVAEHASRAKTTFLNSMSHDIRTPMNAIIGFTALAETHLDSKDLVKEYLSKIHTSSSHLLSLINEILDMSRIESGTVKLEENRVHMPDVLHDLRTMIYGQVKGKQQNLYIDTLDVTHEDVITDKLRLNQVLLNIVGNAIKYTGVGGSISIRVAELPCKKKNHTTYRFSVKDNGIGMSPEFKGRIFEAFAREKSTTISGIQGTGLGMSITKNIVDLMGGKIEVESEKGKGSEFIVTVDFKLGDAKEDNEPISELLGARALVVDDDVYTCQSVCKMLRDIKMRAEWTTSGKESLIRAKEAFDLNDEYKVYIIDYLMPDMNGIEVIRRLRALVGDEAPIIILTAYDWSDFEEEAREAGVTAFISKPIFMSELRAVLSKKENKAEEQEEETKLDCSGKRALLVEDNDLNREIATSILTDLGFEVEEAKDGIEAISIIGRSEEDRYDIIFMDIQMPRMDGYTATREIRTLKNNRKANIPIVAMTANAFEEDRQKAFESGMNAHIAKPIDARTISKTIAPFFTK